MFYPPSMGKVHKGYHCAWQIHYHIVFPVKYRKALLDEEVACIIIETAQGISDRYAIEMESIGCDKDHIHLLCSAHPKMAPGGIVCIFKSITAREIFCLCPEVKKQLWGGEFWTDGYFGSTVSKHGDENMITNYVKKQGKGYQKLHQNLQLALF